MSPKRAEPVAHRIERSVAIDERGCWVWQLCILQTGYGCIRVGGKTRNAHRVSYETFRGPVPDGLVLDHLCRNRACVNPDHLEPVTPRENVLRGMARQVKADITHCPRGHAYDEPNTYSWRGRRFCRACNQAACERYRASRVAS